MHTPQLFCLLLSIMRRIYFFYLLSKLWAGYYSFEDWVGMIFSASLLSRLTRNFWNGVQISFERCFLARLSDLEVSRFLDESKAVAYFKALYKRWEKRAITFLESSKIACLSKEIKKEFRVIPVKMGSMIAVFSILINMVLSIIFKKETSLLIWIIQGLILFAGLGGFSCESSWATVRKGSVVYNKIFK